MPKHRGVAILLTPIDAKGHSALAAEPKFLQIAPAPIPKPMGVDLLGAVSLHAHKVGV